MAKIVLTLAFCTALAGCATTTNTNNASSEACVGEIEETTGSRVDRASDCPPAR
jgi:uncharacterized protein YceK